MHKKRLLTLAVVVLASFAGRAHASTDSTNSTKQASRPPNIIVILADDLGWADLPSYGNKVLVTPHLDALAKSGMRFTHFYAAPVCSPSRAELQSGLHAARLGITDWIPGWERPFERVITPRTALSYPATAITIGEALRAQGYATAYFGKWHLGEPAVQPANRGYQETWVGEQPRGKHHFLEDGTPVIEAIGDRAMQFLERRQRSPFFLMLSLSQPHIPLRAEPKKVAKYASRLKASGESIPDPVYAAMVEDLDDLVGRVIQKLDELELADSTMVIFVSDNGGVEYLPFGLGGRVTSNAPLRGEKGAVYEGGIRVPFIVRWPRVVQAGVVQETPGAMHDLLPTFLEVAGVPASERTRFDGRSLVRTLRGEVTSALRDRALYFHYPHYGASARPAGAVIHWPWKLVQHLDDESIELYDLSQDVGEQHNVGAKHPMVVTDLNARLSRWREQVAAKMPEPNPAYDRARAAEWWWLPPVAPAPVDPQWLRETFGPRELQPIGEDSHQAPARALPHLEHKPELTSK